MKLSKQLALILATGIAFAACDKKPEGAAPAGGTSGGGAAAPAVDEKTAIANFKTELEGVTKWMEEKQKSVATDPAAGMAMMGEIVAKFKSVKTDGLPADLKAGWGEMTVAFGEMGEVFKGISLPKAGGNPEDALKALGDVMPKMMAIQEKMKPTIAKMEELGKKYGIDMTKVSPK